MRTEEKKNSEVNGLRGTCTRKVWVWGTCSWKLSFFKRPEQLSEANGDGWRPMRNGALRLHILPKGQSVRGTTVSPMVPTSSPRPAPSSIRPICGAFPGRGSTSRRIAEGMTEKPGPGLDCLVLSAAECVILGALKREPQRSKCRLCLMYLTSAARPALAYEGRSRSSDSAPLSLLGYCCRG